MKASVCHTLLFVIMLCATKLAAAELSADWSTNTAVLTSTNENERPVLVYFTATWCGPCKLMARTTFASEAVTQQLEKVTRLSVDIDQFPTLAEQFSVRAVPTFVLWSAGNEIVRATGYRDEQAFLEWFANGVSETSAAIARRSRIRAQIAEVDSDLKSDDPEINRRATTQLFEILSENDSAGLEQALARLKERAARSPADLMPGLNHSRLVVRIHTANILREKFGDRFNVDPWCDAAEREQAVREFLEESGR